MSKSKPYFFSKEEKLFLKENVIRKSNLELTNMFNREFNKDLAISVITNAKKRYKLRSGLSRQFEKGHNPWNKGTKGLTGPNKTSFKKGNKPYFYKEVGSEVIGSDGYIKIKTADPNLWKKKHRLVYEKNYGRIPGDHVVIFLDGNKMNCDIENLSLISKSQLSIMNKRKLFKDDFELTRTGVLIAKTLDKAYSIIRGDHQ